MTKDDNSSSEEGTVSDAAAAAPSKNEAGIDGDNDDDDGDATATATASVGGGGGGGGGGKDETEKRYGFSMTLIPTLLFKFTIVLCIKFATDVIVFPTLFLYRLARLGKRKIVGGFDNLFGRRRGAGGDIDVRVNGDGSSSADDDSTK
jgi:hypothetical protein